MILAAFLALAAQVTPPEGLVVFGFEGQSHASGRAPLASAPANLLTPHFDASGNVDVYTFGNDYQWRAAVEPVDSATGQIDSVSVDSTAAVGPAMAFGLAYVETHPGARVALVPCAKGSTTIHEWRRQSLVDGTLTPMRSNLYGSCLHRIHQALLAPGAVLGGIIIMQGDSDARPSTVYAQPNTYADQVVRWVKILRADLDDPALPVVFAQLGPTPPDSTLTEWGMVKAQQAQARSRLMRVGMIVTDDLAVLSDGLHFTAASNVEIGRRFAEAMTAVENQP